jgi:hypothetical protein
MIATSQMRHHRVIIQQMSIHMTIVKRHIKMLIGWWVENHQPTGTG